MPFPNRALIIVLLLISGLTARAEVRNVRIDHEYIVGLATERAAAPFNQQAENLPRFLQDLTYDEYRRIRFIEEHALWGGAELPFRAQFFHPGNLFRHAVDLHEFTGEFSQRIPFVRTWFDYQDLKLAGRLPGTLGYPGFRLLYSINAPDRFDEVISFLGASYYRGLGRHHRYGMSARGLALGFGGPEAEEFPDFVAFWLGKPQPGATTMTLHALLDSPSVAGAFTFTVTPGEDTVVRTQVSLFFRRSVTTLGLAPLTSMFWFGENSADRFGDFRSEVHDSDGLLVAVDADRRIWRPLHNPPTPRVTTFPASAGFGLLQRDRAYHNYEDAEARYERRPGVWIQPVGTWPAGHVRLLEIPAADEYSDNIVAAFVPDEPPAAGARFDYTYDQLWTGRASFGGPSARVRSTRQTVRVEKRPGRTKYVVDYEPGESAPLPPDSIVAAEVHAPPPVSVLVNHLQRNEADGSWRLTLLLDAPPDHPPVELRAALVRDGQPVSETWTTLWTP